MVSIISTISFRRQYPAHRVHTCIIYEVSLPLNVIKKTLLLIAHTGMGPIINGIRPSRYVLLDFVH